MFYEERVQVTRTHTHVLIQTDINSPPVCRIKSSSDEM